MSRKDRKSNPSLYEQVLQKNFAIIQKFLGKFQTVFQKQHAIQQTIETIEQRILDIQKSLKASQEQNKTTIQIYDNKMRTVKNCIEEFNQKIRGEHFKSILQFIQYLNKESDEALCSRQQLVFLPEHISEIHLEEKVQKSNPHKKWFNVIQSVVKSQLQLYKNSDYTSQKMHSLQIDFSTLSKQIKNLRSTIQKIELRQGCKNGQDKFESFSMELKGSFYSPKEENNKDSFAEQIDPFLAQCREFLKEDSQQKREELQKTLDRHKKIVYNLYDNLQKKISEKVSLSLNELQQKIINIQTQMSKAIQNNFANKSETKQGLLLLEKKIKKLEIIEEIISYENKDKTNPIHSFFQKQRNSDIQDNEFKKKYIKKLSDTSESPLLCSKQNIKHLSVDQKSYRSSKINFQLSKEKKFTKKTEGNQNQLIVRKFGMNKFMMTSN